MEATEAGSRGAPGVGIRNKIATQCELKIGGEQPKAMIGGSAVSTGSVVYLFGGMDESTVYGDLWILELGRAQWRLGAAGGFSKPQGRFGHTFLAVEGRNEFYVFGGMAKQLEAIVLSSGSRETRGWAAPACCAPHASPDWGFDHSALDDLYTLNEDNLRWEKVARAPRALWPERRGFHAACTTGTSLVIHGGLQPKTNHTYDDLWTFDYDVKEWLQSNVDESAVGPRYGHAMCYDESSRQLYLFGGHETDSTLWTVDAAHCGTTQWRPVDCGNAPLPRCFHSLSSVNGRLVLLGGLDQWGAADLFTLDLRGTSPLRWVRPLHQGTIGARAAAVTLVHDKLFSIGGCIGGLAETLGSMPNAASFWIQWQPLTPTAVYSFVTILEIKTENRTSDAKFKVVTVGDSGVGKTSLLTRFAQDAYSEFHVATIGVDYKSVVTLLQGTLCTMQLWDTAGQERFAGITGSYYRNADGFVIVIDATRRESFLNVDRWLDQIQHHADTGPHTVKMLILNKCDLKKEIKVTYEEVAALAKRTQAILVPASAKSAANVDNAFLQMLQELETNRKKTLATSSLPHIRDHVLLASQRTQRNRPQSCADCTGTLIR